MAAMATERPPRLTPTQPPGAHPPNRDQLVLDLTRHGDLPTGRQLIQVCWTSLIVVSKVVPLADASHADSEAFAEELD